MTTAMFCAIIDFGVVFSHGEVGAAEIDAC